MDRRNFLTGMIQSVAATSLVVVASEAEIAAFASPIISEAQTQVFMERQEPSGLMTAYLKPGDVLYDDKGEAVAKIVNVLVERAGDYDDLMSGHFHVTPRPMRYQIEARGILPLKWN